MDHLWTKPIMLSLKVQKIELTVDKADQPILELLLDEISPFGHEEVVLVKYLKQIVAKSHGNTQS